ncbi:Smr/MutS family protein [Robiginitalea aurantiaca]|uniref:DNA mismatch repair protein MutS n=1 Tax=Robiginitalea aurantiaca TaxID=3056915 RepID=A0ABT7WCV5_9FLAO|nr:Smr/MutS family protein [Robiginitalea aurantiaca]MDM9630745.1 DNA mismatch repair protein MutS [Robiginitalea aurantiaca]
MSRFKPGDRVQMLDEMVSGTVVSVTAQGLQMRTSDGFVLEVAEGSVVLLPEDDGALLGNIDFRNALKDSDTRPAWPKRTGRRPRQAPPMEVDLHIEKLVPSSKGLNPVDILDFQLDAARGQLEFALRKKIQRIVFIHGVGQGVLREELKTLFRRYEGLEVRDADPRSYGMGATEVYVTQAGMR